MLYAKLLRTFAGAGADTPWSEGYYNHCDPVPVCKVRAGAAVVVLTPVPARDTCLGVSISTYLYIYTLSVCVEGVAVVVVTHVLVRDVSIYLYILSIYLYSICTVSTEGVAVVVVTHVLVRAAAPTSPPHHRGRGRGEAGGRRRGDGREPGDTSTACPCLFRMNQHLIFVFI